MPQWQAVLRWWLLPFRSLSLHWSLQDIWLWFPVSRSSALLQSDSLSLSYGSGICRKRCDVPRIFLYTGRWEMIRTSFPSALYFSLQNRTFLNPEASHMSYPTHPGSPEAVGSVYAGSPSRSLPDIPSWSESPADSSSAQARPARSPSTFWSFWYYARSVPLHPA